MKRLSALIVAAVVVAGCGSSSQSTSSGSTNTGPPGSGSTSPAVTVAPALLTDPANDFTYLIQAKSDPIQESTDAKGLLAGPGTYYWVVNGTIQNTDKDKPAPWPTSLTGAFQGSHPSGSTQCTLTTSQAPPPPDTACYFYTNTLNEAGLTEIPAGQTVSVAFETRDPISATVNSKGVTFLVALQGSVASGVGVPLSLPSA
jgi:hypothetical protein